MTAAANGMKLRLAAIPFDSSIRHFMSLKSR